jgi:apolipoprotein D and lipocalin family protein
MRRLLLGLVVASSPALAQEVRPVTGFDVERYLGVWHEVAAIPTSFQRDCVFDTTATYGTDGEYVTVDNACRTADGEVKRSEGVARFKGPRDVAALEVTFVTILGIPLWLAGGDYIVIALDPDYAWSAVAHPSRDYAWILAREANLDVPTLQGIAKAYEEAGYDTCTLLTSRQVRNDVRQPLCTVGDTNQNTPSGPS